MPLSVGELIGEELPRGASGGVSITGARGDEAFAVRIGDAEAGLPLDAL